MQKQIYPIISCISTVIEGLLNINTFLSRGVNPAGVYRRSPVIIYGVFLCSWDDIYNSKNNNKDIRVFKNNMEKFYCAYMIFP